MADKAKTGRRGWGWILVVGGVVALIVPVFGPDDHFEVARRDGTGRWPCIKDRNVAGLVVAECRDGWHDRLDQRVWWVIGGLASIGVGALVLRPRRRTPVVWDIGGT